MEGRILNRGEVSLAHLGVLFLDELLEFNKSTLEVLRIPIEDRKVNISRVGLNISYPCNFMLIASTNPCPCGYYGSNDKECTCSEKQRNNYKSRLSGPMMDRFDIQIKVPSVEYSELKQEEQESSEAIRNRVNKARKIQQERYKEYGIYSNSELTPKLIERYCSLRQDASKLLELSFNKLKMSSRAYFRVLKVARTIADLEDSENIELGHIAESLQYRTLNKT